MDLLLFCLWFGLVFLLFVLGQATRGQAFALCAAFLLMMLGWGIYGDPISRDVLNATNTTTTINFTYAQFVHPSECYDGASGNLTCYGNETVYLANSTTTTTHAANIWYKETLAADYNHGFALILALLGLYLFFAVLNDYWEGRRGGDD
jgi:hypothetical protein